MSLSSKFPSFSCPNLKVKKEGCLFLLADFGIAQNTKKPTDFGIQVGDNQYLAPELHRNLYPQTGKILQKADIYSSGLVFLQLALGIAV